MALFDSARAESAHQFSSRYEKSKEIPEIVPLSQIQNTNDI